MERRVVSIRGTVQGVGFRPFIYTLATRLQLAGFVRNHTTGVCVEVEGDTPVLDKFLDALRKELPPLARIEEVDWRPQMPRGDRRFQIEPSESTREHDAVVISPDAATCDECLADLFDPTSRYFLYPFVNCTNCGPRLTVVTGAPYDRERTTMACFAMCAACREEFEDPRSRRFHAQPIACPRCGPRLSALDGNGNSIVAEDPLAVFVDAIRAGGIGAIKGIGGYHLVCDAHNVAAVNELRRRKQRDEKPFAVMVGSISAAQAICLASETERKLLQSSRRPIVLLRKKVDGSTLSKSLAPGNPDLGVMLPYAPLHHMLMRSIGSHALVMTSGNRSDEPIAFDEQDAVNRLAGIADIFLSHNRPIHVRCDDSVTRVIAGEESLLRRSRGYAPQPIVLPVATPVALLAVGGQLKATFALGQERQAVVSHHLGDLDHFQAYQAFETDVALYERLLNVRPQAFVHDLHPNYASTRYATTRGKQEGLPCVGVQHHHAHMASCMAEHGLSGPAMGVTFDGTGFGHDGAVWGGEFLVGDYAQVRRAAHLRYVGMPGGEKAIREPWRMALAHLADASSHCNRLERRLSEVEVRTVGRMLERRLNTPLTSSAGRLFDAVAAMAGVCDRVSYEGQAAMQLEWLATQTSAAGEYSFDIDENDASSPLIVDTRPLIECVARESNAGVDAAVIARRFHSTVVSMIAAVCKSIRNSAGLTTVVLSGGVFMNALLSREVAERLERSGFIVYRQRMVPPNDGGLSLGQIAVAAAVLAGQESKRS